MKVRDLKKALEGAPDDLEVRIGVAGMAMDDDLGEFMAARLRFVDVELKEREVRLSGDNDVDLAEDVEQDAKRPCGSAGCRTLANCLCDCKRCCVGCVGRKGASSS